MKYFQTDDIPEDDIKKDCVHTYYRIVLYNVIIKEGRHAIKQTRNIENRIIYKRKWNESKRMWKDDDWTLVQQYKDTNLETFLT